MKNLSWHLMVSLSLLVCITTLNAQWVPTNGPEGGYILSFASIDSNIYAGTDGGGVYISNNGGSSWTQSNNGLNYLNVQALAASGSNLFAAAWNTWGGSKIYVSTNGGASWSSSSKGLPNDSSVVFQIDCFAVDTNATSSSNIFAGALDGGVYCSTDNGANWTADTVGLLNKFVVSLTIEDTNLYAGTFVGVFHSTTQATAWAPAALADVHYNSVQSIVELDSTLFASGGGVFRSTNKGESWVQVNSNNNVGPIALLDTELLAGTSDGTIYRSTNNGTSWIKQDNLVGAIRTISAIGTNLFAGTYGGGVFLSTDGGLNWNAVNNGLKNSKVNGVAVKDSDIFAGTDAVGVFRSTDDGNSWSQANTGLTSLDVKGIAVSDSALFVGVSSGGVFKSTDDGESWMHVGKDTTGLYNTFALAASGNYIFAGALGPGVYRSTDEGNSWVLSNSGITNTGVTALAASDSILFTGTYGGGIFKSTNNGTNWISAGLTGHYVAALALDGPNVYAKTYDAGLFVSTNSGTTWGKADDSGMSEDSIISLAANTSSLYAGSNAGVLYRPVAEITSINRISNKLLMNFKLFQNYPNPFNPSTVINYQLPVRSFVTLKVYDILGRVVATLVKEVKNAGSYSITFNSNKLSSGIYIYSLRAGDKQFSRKMILLK
jgi:Secretion system C-terminal sorting domain